MRVPRPTAPWPTPRLRTLARLLSRSGKLISGTVTEGLNRSSSALVSTLKPWFVSMVCRLSRLESMASKWSLSSVLSRQATLRHFSGAGAGAEERASGRAVAEAVGAGSLSRRMESMKVVGDKGVSATEGGRLGLASSTRGLRGGLGGSSLTRITGLCSRVLPGEARGLQGPSSVMSEMMGPELVATSGE